MLAGGVSLGSYEAGYAATIVRYLRAHPDRYVLRAVAGTSAGAINAFASAVEYCRAPHDELPLPAEAWQPIGWGALYDSERVGQTHVFHHDLLREHGRSLTDASRFAGRPDCSVDVFAALTRYHEEPDAPAPGPRSWEDFVQYVAFRVASEDGAFRWLPLRSPEDCCRDTRSLTINNEGEIEGNILVDALLASAAFPIAFPPVELALCDNDTDAGDSGLCTEERAARERYIDGGVFDNVPVGALLSALRNTSDDALVIVVDLDNEQIPGEQSSGTSPFDTFSRLAEQWLRYARTRDYARAIREAERAGATVVRATQRLPAASGFMEQFLGFFDRTFRDVDYLLGQRDARRDLTSRFGFDTSTGSARYVDERARCLELLLSNADDGAGTSCAGVLSTNELVTLRALDAATRARCENAPEDEALPEVCAAAAERAEAGIWPEAPVSASRESRLRRAHGRASTSGFQAFLEELRLGDFDSEMQSTRRIRSTGLGVRPEILWSRVAEDAMDTFANTQDRGRLATELALEAMLASAIPVLARPSGSFLVNLDGLEAGINVPLSPRFLLDVGVGAEWGLRAEREHGWHLLSAGPALRLGALLSKREALVALIASVDAGLLFGPVFPSVEENSVGLRDGRRASRPNAAVYAGIAPRALFLRRVQVDLPIRAYWLCTTPYCGSYASATPALSVMVRVGWNFTFRPGVVYREDD